nr:hypothetical protein [Opitutales bacterium]
HFTLSLFFLSLSTNSVSGEHVQLQTASVMPQTQDVQAVSLLKEAPAVKMPPVTPSVSSRKNNNPEVHTQSQPQPSLTTQQTQNIQAVSLPEQTPVLKAHPVTAEVRIWTADDIRRYIRVHGALNTCATFSLTLQRELETLRDDIQSIQNGIRSIVRINNKLGLDAHIAEILASCYEDCFDKLFRFPKSSAKSPFSDCILWLKNAQGTLETLNGRMHTLKKTLVTLPHTPNTDPIVDSTSDRINSATDKLSNKVFNKAQILLPILYEFSQQERQHGWSNIPWL